MRPAVLLGEKNKDRTRERAQITVIGVEPAVKYPFVYKDTQTRRKGHVRYVNILTWLRGFRVKIVNFLSCFCLLIGHYRNVRGLGKSMVFRLFEKLRYSNERSTIF